MQRVSDKVAEKEIKSFENIIQCTLQCKKYHSYLYAVKQAEQTRKGRQWKQKKTEKAMQKK